jgi:hypothetical protein
MPWAWIALLFAGGAFAYQFSSHLTDEQKIELAVQACIAKENNPQVLILFAQKLRAAGYDVEADKVDAKLNQLHGVTALTSNTVITYAGFHP